MTIGHATHLSEESINDALIGLGSPEAEAHLAECRECRARIEAFRADMRIFNGTMLAWSEARSATMAAPARAKIRARDFVPAAWAAAMTILLALAIPMWRQQHVLPGHETRNAAAVTEAGQDTETQIAEDNDLMRSVDVALSTSEEAPVAEGYFTGRPQPRQHSRPELRKP